MPTPAPTTAPATVAAATVKSLRQSHHEHVNVKALEDEIASELDCDDGENSIGCNHTDLLAYIAEELDYINKLEDVAAAAVPDDETDASIESEAEDTNTTDIEFYNETSSSLDFEYDEDSNATDSELYNDTSSSLDASYDELYELEQAESSNDTDLEEILEGTDVSRMYVYEEESDSSDDNETFANETMILVDENSTSDDSNATELEGDESNTTDPVELNSSDEDVDLEALIATELALEKDYVDALKDAAKALGISLEELEALLDADVDSESSDSLDIAFNETISIENSTVETLDVDLNATEAGNETDVYSNETDRW